MHMYTYIHNTRRRMCRSVSVYEKRPIDMAKETYILGLVALKDLLRLSFPFYQKTSIDMAKETYILGLVALEGLPRHSFPFYPL